MSSRSDVKVGRAAGKTMLMCGRSYCVEQTLLLGSFNLLGEGHLCDLTVDLDCNNIAVNIGGFLSAKKPRHQVGKQPLGAQSGNSLGTQGHLGSTLSGGCCRRRTGGLSGAENYPLPPLLSWREYFHLM